MAEQEQQLSAACKAADAVTQGLVHRMLMELETGGNIRSAIICAVQCFHIVTDILQQASALHWHDFASSIINIVGAVIAATLVIIVIVIACSVTPVTLLVIVVVISLLL